MDLIEKIGPFAGLLALIGLAVLAFLIFQQSRDLRRLREWAGRAPERAKEAADASLAAAEARGEVSGEQGPGRLARVRAGVAGFVSPRWQRFDNSLPIDGRIALGVLVAGVVAAAVLTSGFGLIGDEDAERPQPAQRQQPKREAKPEVAVLNATQTDGVQGVPGLADKVASEVVKQAGYDVVQTTNAPAGLAETVVMFEPDQEGAAAEFARAISSKLGSTGTEEMAADIRAVARDAPVVLVVGADDQGF